MKSQLLLLLLGPSEWKALSKIDLILSKICLNLRLNHDIQKKILNLA